MKKNNLTPIVVIVAVCFGLIVGGFISLTKADNEAISVEAGGVLNIYNDIRSAVGGMLGGTTNFDDLEVDSLTSSGAISGTTVGGTNATFSGTLDVSGETVVEGLTSGNGVFNLATSTGTTVLTEANLLAYNYIRMMVNTGSTAALTFPATSTMTTLLPNAGDSRDFCIENATSSTMALTITAGAGIRLVASTNAMDVIDETEVSCITFIRESDTDILGVMTDELVDVD